MTEQQQRLNDLIEELREEGSNGDVVVEGPDACIQIYVDDESYEAGRACKISGKDCQIVFASVASVERLVDALELDEETHVDIHDVVLDGRVLDFLETAVGSIDDV